jgi:hypothetical protein
VALASAMAGSSSVAASAVETVRTLILFMRRRFASPGYAAVTRR